MYRKENTHFIMEIVFYSENSLLIKFKFSLHILTKDTGHFLIKAI